MEDRNGFTWHYLVVLWAAVVAVVTGGIWIGSLSGQIVINTKRLDKIENFLDELRGHDANTTADQRAQDARISRLERLYEGRKPD